MPGSVIFAAAPAPSAHLRARGAGVISGLRIIVLGKQGSGKGTQSQQLAQRLAVPHISTGDILRAAVRGDSTTAREVKAVMDVGELISDQLVFDLVAERLAAADARHRGFVLDGFPRSIDQAKQLFRLLGDNGVDAAVTLDVPTAEVIRRLSARRVCLSCGRNYQVAQTPQLNEWTCGSCGGHVARRDDDTEVAIRTRLAVCDKTTRPLLQWLTDETPLGRGQRARQSRPGTGRSATRLTPRTGG